MEGGWIAAVAGALGSLVTVAVTQAIKWVRVRYPQQREQRQDTLSEWQRIVDRLEQEIREGQKDWRKEAKELRDRSEEDRKRAAECELRAARQEGEIRLLQATVQRLQSRTGDVMPPAVPAVITADLHGTIRDAAGACAPLLHWLPQQLRGKNVEVLIPEDLRDRHRGGLARFRGGEPPPWSEKTILTEVLTKDGERTPVSVRLYAWRAGSEWLVTAEIQRRPAPVTPPEGGQ